MRFRVEELILIKNYDNIANDGRSGCIRVMQDSIPYTEDVFIKSEVEEVIRKLELISDEEFKDIDYSPMPINILDSLDTADYSEGAPEYMME